MDTKNLTQDIVGIVIASVVAIAVGYTVINNLTKDMQDGDMLKIIFQLIPLFIALAILLAIASWFSKSRRSRKG